MKKLILAAALLVVATSAQAQTYMTSGTFRGQSWSRTTTVFPPAVYGPQVQSLPPILSVEEQVEHAERIARMKAWEERCKPKAGPPDANGIQRYTYAAPNCDVGN